MTTYTVTVKNTSSSIEPDAFSLLHHIDPDAVVELVEVGGAFEVYTIQTERNMDTYLDTNDAVVSYDSAE